MSKKRFDPIEGRNAEIIEWVMSCEELSDLSEDILFKMRLCVEEVEENILCYSGSTWVEVCVTAQKGFLSVNFRDGGVQFNPLAKKDPDITASVEDRAIGGLGIFICKKMMDSVEYSCEDGCNVFTMTAKIA